MRLRDHWGAKRRHFRTRAPSPGHETAPCRAPTRVVVARGGARTCCSAKKRKATRSHSGRALAAHNARAAMTSGYGFTGGQGRCHPLWLNFNDCLRALPAANVSSEQARACLAIREDYYECATARDAHDALTPTATQVPARAQGVPLPQSSGSQGGRGGREGKVVGRERRRRRRRCGGRPPLMSACYCCCLHCRLAVAHCTMRTGQNTGGLHTESTQPRRRCRCCRCCRRGWE